MPKKSWIEYLIEDENKAVGEYIELANVLKKLGYSKFSTLVLKVAKEESRHKEILIQIRDSVK